MNDITLDALREWLLSRECDIAFGIEDFGELKEVFSAVVGRSAREYPLGVTVAS